MKTRKSGPVRFTPAADYTAYEGYLVTLAVDTATLSSSATVPATAVVMEGGTVAQGVGVGILGNCDGGVHMKTSGIIARGARVQQAADGTIVTDAGTGARVVVGVANEASVSGDIIEVFPFTPQVYTA